MDWNELQNKLVKSKYCYHYTKNGVLLCGDCLEVMNEIPKESVDLILTDPPYNISDNNKLTKVGNKIVTNKEAWGDKFKDHWNSQKEYDDWLLSVIKISKNILNVCGSFIIFLNRKYTGYYIYLFESFLNLYFKNKIYFQKTNPLPHFRKNNYRSTIEEAVWLVKTKNKYIFNFLSQSEMLQIFSGSIGKKFSKHPTEKYKWMIVPLILRHSYKNNVVLDCFMGSGTIAEVCEKLNRKWIGIEINEEYCEITKERLEDNLK